MIVNGRNFDVEYAIHNVSMECAKIQLQRNEMNGPIAVSYTHLTLPTSDLV